MNRLFSKDKFIFHQGDEGDCAYIIEKGSVEIFLEESGVEISISMLGVGEIFGEMAILDSCERSASARALEDCDLFAVSRCHLYSHFEKADSTIQLLMKVFLRRLRAGLEEKARERKPFQQSNTEASLSIKPHHGNGKSHETHGNYDEDQGSCETHGHESYQVQEIINKIRFEQDIQEAFEKKELFVCYQPIVNMASHQLAGFEALVRWKSPTKGLPCNDIFLAVAEDRDLMRPIGRWVLQKAIKDLEEINRTVHFKPFMAINISGGQINDSQFFKTLEGGIDKAGCDPSQVKLEITEKVFVEKRAAMRWIRRCQQMGVTVALDDFGTEYSSLGALTQLRVDNLKIDRFFVSRLLMDRASTVVVQGLISIARGLNIPVVAEGVETRKQEQGLSEMGCSYGQGYFYSKPLSLELALDLCQQNSTAIQHSSLQRTTEAPTILT